MIFFHKRLMKQFKKDLASCFSVSFAFVGDEFFR